VRSPAVKRLMREAMELHEPTDQYYAQPLEDNIFEWHFTVRGAPDTDFANGRYHGRIILPPEYPMKPPSIILLTPNGRFEIGKKICLSMSAHHPETWQPSWSIRTVLLAIIGFMPSRGEGAIGALEYTREERRKLAKKSQTWVCTLCGSNNSTCLLEGRDNEASAAASAAESMRIAEQISFKSAPEDSARKKDKGMEVNSGKHSDSVAEGLADKSTESSTILDKDIPSGVTSTENRCTEADTGAALDTTNSEANEIPHGDNVAQDGKISANTDGVRKRTLASSRDDAKREMRNDIPVSKNESSGMLSLVLLWIVVLTLLILIFRRLCMDALSIGNSK